MLKLDPEPDQFRTVSEHPLHHPIDLGELVVLNHLDPMPCADQCRANHGQPEVLFAISPDQ
jgi:hypothetical protein